MESACSFDWTPHRLFARSVLWKLCIILYGGGFAWHSFKHCRLVLFFLINLFIYLVLAFILLFVSSTVLFIYLHSLCALSQGCEQRLSAGNSLCYHVTVERAPIQRYRTIFFKGETVLSTASYLYSAMYKDCPLWHSFISYCLWQSLNWGREKLSQRSKLEPVEREREQAGRMSDATGHRGTHGAQLGLGTRHLTYRQMLYLELVAV